jgi:hypothetical protein
VQEPAVRDGSQHWRHRSLPLHRPVRQQLEGCRADEVPARLRRRAPL